MPDAPAFERDVARLVAACEAGADLPALLNAAAAAIAGALGAGTASVYTLTEGGTELIRVQGDGPATLDAPALEPVLANGRAIVPLVSARRLLGCVLTDTVREPAGLSRARLAAGLAAQAVEAARLWESAGAGAGTLDLLTGLPNHLGFQSVLGRELARATRTGQSLAVCLVDLDGLAGYNERHGAAEGDRVLRLAAECLAAGVRSYDCVCRLDEDEFALVLPGMSAEPAAALVGRLSETFGGWSSDDRRMTVSGGVAAFPEHGATSDELVRLAHGALSRARDAGGDRVVAWDGAREAPDAAGRELERAIRSVEASRGHSAASRAVSEYAGHIAGAMGVPSERADRVRLAAYLYDATSPAGDPGERARVAARVAAQALDEEAAGWLLERRGGAAGPVEARAIAVAEAFVSAGGTADGASAGRALAELWGRAGGELDADCVRALERLIADEA
ncbi:MAG TPA: GGDEF domain-containing protein [Gaiellales bacterium]